MNLQVALAHLRCPIHDRGTVVSIDPDAPEEAPFAFSECCDLFGEIVSMELDRVLEADLDGA